ncbi:hypothetical protein [Vitiosangium sp. GDMCC 1.1324]|uniref:hypothetical protein n=1 Tax=Vitiosangium sp. (strain GDMCC 1.1324) TaxID=2138576 RepID=UPI000D35469C|nr:hypothetical protein [Vitiosangium sp. GDMCC 1.1324]PTL80541.1 hypothetical protein DAT35_28330 [Vitiosangium sp. GDMCC 1.1324]
MAKPAGFDRDIGYLMPFLDRVAAAAAELPEASAREELARLMAEEKVRWARIQQLLGGAAGREVPSAASGAQAAVSPSTSSSIPGLARAHADEINREQPRQAGLTVGSLKRQS